MEVEVPTVPPTRFRFTNYDKNVTRGLNADGDPIIYYSYPSAPGEFRETQKGDLQNLTVNIANVTLELMTYLEQHDGLEGQPCSIRLTSVSALSDPNADMLWNGEVVRCSVDNTVVSFSVGSPNLTQRDFPRNRYNATGCRSLPLGTAECGYVIPLSPTESVGGGFSSCGGTRANCQERGDDEEARGLTRQHPRRWGAFPGTQRG